MRREWVIIGVLCVFIMVVYIASMYYGPQLSPRSSKDNSFRKDSSSSRCLTESCRQFVTEFAKPIYESASKQLLKSKG